MFKVYILVSRKRENWSYVGYTGDMTSRFAQHVAGKVKSTKEYRPLDVVHTEEFETEEGARKRELYLKSGFGREEKRMIIKQSRVV